MTIPPAHRKWLIVFGVSVVVWVGLAVATVAGKSSLKMRAFKSIFSVTLSGGAFYISSFDDGKLDPGFYASIEPEKLYIEPPPFIWPLFYRLNFGSKPRPPTSGCATSSSPSGSSPYLSSSPGPLGRGEQSDEKSESPQRPITGALSAPHPTRGPQAA